MDEVRAQKQSANKMGTMPVHRLLVTMAVPLIISMLVQAMYNVVDSVFVSWISEDALSAVSLVFPIQNLMIAVASGTGVGMNALVSRKLGQKKREEASKTANVGIFLIVCSFLVFLVIGATCSRGFLRVQTDIRSIVDYGTTYMRIVTVLGLGLFGQVTMERLLQSTGRTVFPMVTQLIGAGINLVFDPLLIFGIGPFPELGVAGAALATVFGQWVAMIMAVIFNFKFNHDVRLDIRQMRPDGRIIKEIYAIAIPSILMISIGSVMTFCLNKILLGFTSTAIAVMGAYSKIQSIVFMPLFGLNNATIPIVGYNFGAGSKERIRKTQRIASMYACLFMWTGLVLMQFFPVQILRIFRAEDYMLEIGVPALRIMSILFAFAGISVICSGLFQAVGKSVYSLIVSLIRQLLVLIPAALLLAQLGDVTYVWMAFPIAEAVGFITALVLRRKLNKNMDAMMKKI